MALCDKMENGEWVGIGGKECPAELVSIRAYSRTLKTLGIRGKPRNASSKRRSLFFFTLFDL